MKKRVRQVSAFILSLAMLVCALSGCGNSGAKETEEINAEKNTEE